MTDLTARTEVERPPAPTTADVTEAPRRHSRGRSVLKHLLLIAASLLMIYPLVWLLVSSFRPTDVIFRTPGLWLNDVYLDNYTQGWTSLANPFGHYMLNSAIVVIGAIVSRHPPRRPRNTSRGSAAGPQGRSPSAIRMSTRAAG